MLPEDEEGAQAGHAVGVGPTPGAEASAETSSGARDRQSGDDR